MTNTTTTKKVIIVGGGPGGVKVAETIAAKQNSSGKTTVNIIDVTVIDRQNYMDWSLASPRMLVEPNKIQDMGYVMPLEKVLEHVGGKKTKNGTNTTKFVQGSVKKIYPTKVELEDDGSTLTADIIVIAIGGQYKSGALWKPLPNQTSVDARIEGFKALHQKCSKSKGIVVAGAGPTGVEVAGEIKCAFPDCKVTIVGSLLPNSSKVLQTRMKTALEKMAIVVKDDGRVDDVMEPDANRQVKLRDGSIIDDVDLVLNAAGFSFSGKELASDDLKKDLTERGQFNCKPTLQLLSCETVFCCGDILAVPQGKYADVKGLQHADMTAEMVGKNVVATLAAGQKLHDFQWSSKPIDKPMMTALGRKVAVGYIGLPNFIENFIGRQVKCKDYYMSLKGSLYGKGKTW